MKPITIKELKEILNQYDENLPVVILKDGPGHHYPITCNKIKIISSCYFPDLEWEEPVGKILQLEII